MPRIQDYAPDRIGGGFFSALFSFPFQDVLLFLVIILLFSFETGIETSRATSDDGLSRSLFDPRRRKKETGIRA